MSLTPLNAVSPIDGISGDYWKWQGFISISSELSKQGKIKQANSVIQDALSIAGGISNDFFRSISFAEISSELANKGLLAKANIAMQEALANALGLNGDMSVMKNSALIRISSELAKQGHFEQALARARGIDNADEKNSALAAICAELAKQGDMDDAIVCLGGIDDDKEKSFARTAISVEYAKRGQVIEAELIGLEISQLVHRHNCWKQIAIANLEKHSWEMAVYAVQEYKSDEARLFCLRGWCEQVKITEVSSECIIKILPLIAFDSDSIEALLRKYAVRETLLCKPKYLLQQRLNATLNIQWAIDIAAQFPNLETKARLSTNLEAWLHEIVDEDDREQIELWAKQVAKGKITEEEFGQRVSEI